MKKIKIAVLLFAAHLFSAQIQNAGFENNLDAWKFQKISTFNLETDNTVAHSGKKSLKISNSETTTAFQYFSQKVPVSNLGGKKLEISGYIKSQNLNGEAAIWIQVWDINGNKN